MQPSKALFKKVMRPDTADRGIQPIKRTCVCPLLYPQWWLWKRIKKVFHPQHRFHLLLGKLSNPAKLEDCEVHSTPLELFKGQPLPLHANAWVRKSVCYQDRLYRAALGRLQAERSTWDELDWEALAGGMKPPLQMLTLIWTARVYLWSQHWGHEGRPPFLKGSYCSFSFHLYQTAFPKPLGPFTHGRNISLIHQQLEGCVPWNMLFLLCVPRPFSITMLFMKFPTLRRTSRITGLLDTFVGRKGITDLWPSKQPRR